MDLYSEKKKGKEDKEYQSQLTGHRDNEPAAKNKAIITRGRGHKWFVVPRARHMESRATSTFHCFPYKSGTCGLGEYLTEYYNDKIRIEILQKSELSS